MSFKPVQTFKIITGATATAAQFLNKLSLIPEGVRPQLKLRGKTTDIVYKLGTSAVAASKTLIDLVTNGTFASDTSWTKGTGWTISGGVANSSGAQTADSSLSQTAADIISGEVYATSFVVTRSAGSVTLKIGGTLGTARSSSATFTENIVAGSGSLVEVIADDPFIGTVDNLTVTCTRLTQGNTEIAAGAIELIDLKTNETHISAISEDGSTAGVLFATLGYGEQI